MSLQTTININVDFYDKKYILINAKQYDRSSRFVLVSCYNHGILYPINSNEHSAYIRYKKSDGNGVFNLCEIVSEGKILAELTEQMLVVGGICYADLVVVNKGEAVVEADTGEITAIDNTSILSTMTFCIDVSESAVENSEIESSYEYNGLNDALEKAEAEYQNVIKTAKSWAVGGTGIRSGEDTDNAKYYCEEAYNSADIARTVASTLNNTFTPMGTVSFSQLATMRESGEIEAGYLYIVSEDFTTDETFKEGAGIQYAAGTSVYYTSDGYWDCILSSTVSGVKGDNETNYRKGNVNLTAENIGAVSSSDVATVDEVVAYLGI